MTPTPPRPKQTTCLVGALLAAWTGSGFVSSAEAQRAILPPTVAKVRCFTGPALDARLGNPCSSAIDDDGDPVISGNSVSASYNPPYDIAVDLRINQVPEEDGFEGADEAGAVGFTKFGIGFLLLEDLPEDFDYASASIPVRMTSSTRFTYSVTPLTGEGDRLPVNEGVSSERFREFVDGRLPGTGLLTERFLDHGGLVQTFRNVYGEASGATIISAITDVSFYDVTWSRVLMEGYTGSDTGLAQIRIDKSLFSKEGDYFVVQGVKGAACVMDTYQENGGCALAFDPVFEFDQDAFDAMMGDKTFSLSRYFALDLSGPGLATVPEPGSWAMMIAGVGGIGYRMRRRAVRYRRRVVL